MSAMWEAAKACCATREQLEELRKMSRSRTEPKQIVLRARIVLLAVEGQANHAIARQLGVSRPTVLLWRSRFEQEGVGGLRKERARGRRFAPLATEKVRAIIEATQKAPPAMTHWSTRTMARAQGVSYASVRRIWNAHGLKPHLVETFKLSTDRSSSRRCTTSSVST
jgi:transposase